MIEHSPEITDLAKALHGAQGMVSGVRKDSKNPAFKNTGYASLEAVIDTARPALQAHGLAFTQAPGGLVDGAIEVTTMLVHVSGQWMRSTLHVPLGKKDAQGVGSAITYGCRYSLMATLGLPPVDDDGEEASRPPPPRPTPREPDDPRTMAADVTPFPGPTATGQRMAREVGQCRSQADLDAMKRTPEFRTFWDAASQNDRRFVQDAASSAVSRFPKMAAE